LVTSALLPLVLVALTVSGIIVVAGWQRRRDLIMRRRAPGLPQSFERAHVPFESGSLDVAEEARSVLRQLEGQAAKCFVELEMAVQPGLTVRADPGAFRSVLFYLLDSAIGAAPCGRILLGGQQIGNSVQISVTDDGLAADGALRHRSLRDAERLTALQGATIRVDARPSQGTTVYLSLPATDAKPTARAGSESADPVSIWTPVRHTVR
jgi:signal transduction histidine kinase